MWATGGHIAFAREKSAPPEDTEGGNTWSVPTDWQTVCRRAAGQNKFNALRTFRADCWRGEIIALLHRWGWHYGVQSQIARHLGLHKTTISRDLKRILPLFRTCAACGELRPRLWVDSEDEEA